MTTTWTYTPLNKPATVTYSGGTAHAVSYGYDASGNRTSISDATGSSTYLYDPFAELASAQNGAGQTVSYGYDSDGNQTGITYPLPGTHSWAATTTVEYSYDNADHLTGVTDFNNQHITITSNADGLPATVSLGASGDTINTTYDNTDVPSAITLKNSSSTLQSFTYADAPSGNILNETDTPSSSLTPAVYTYDAQGRVTSMIPGTGSALNYAFDPSSDLTTLPTGASTSYDKAGELTSSTQALATTSYTYNADGQQITATQGSSTVASGTWNGAGQLTAYSDPAANMTTATYNGDGQRATATSGTSTVGFTWNTVSPVPQVLTDSANAYIYAGGTAPAEQVNLTTGAITYLVTDSLGSVRGTINSSGALTGTTSYDAWGNPQTAGGLTAITPFGFAGGYTDPTGLIYLINRYYDPQVGQFISVDPALAQTQQPYAYAGNNPVTKIDPTGQAWQFLGWAFGQSAWYGGKVTSALLKLVKAFVATISVGVATISVQGAEFQLRWALAVWHYYYEGRATPWFALGATVSTWGRLNITAQVGIFIPGTPINFGVTVWSGYTPAFKLPGSCFGWLYFYNNVLESGGACGLV